VLWKASARVAGPFATCKDGGASFSRQRAWWPRERRTRSAKKDYQVDLVDAAQVGVVAYECVTTLVSQVACQERACGRTSGLGFVGTFNLPNPAFFFLCLERVDTLCLEGSCKGVRIECALTARVAPE